MNVCWWFVIAVCGVAGGVCSVVCISSGVRCGLIHFVLIVLVLFVLGLCIVGLTLLICCLVDRVLCCLVYYVILWFLGCWICFLGCV